VWQQSFRMVRTLDGVVKGLDGVVTQSFGAVRGLDGVLTGSYRAEKVCRGV